MSSILDTTRTPPTASSLSYDRTVPRQRVHRAAISEVFLTDIQVTAAPQVLTAAQLPSSHAFFHDRSDDNIDPLLVLEIARQATIASAHELGVPMDSILISSEFALELNSDALRRLAPTAIHVHIENVFEWTSVRRGVARAGRCDQRLYIDGCLVAEHWSAGRILTREQLLALRSEHRGTPPPLSHELLDSVPQDAVAPALVGRTNPRNVVISGLSETPGRVSAQVTPALNNRALFDHSYDHVTMQILTEAARQLHTAITPGQPAAAEIRAVRGVFHSFAELDSELFITSAKRGRYSVEQEGRPIAELDFEPTCMRSESRAC